MRLLGLACVFLLCSVAPALAQNDDTAIAKDRAPAIAEEGAPAPAPANDPELDPQAIQNQMWGEGRLIKGKVADSKVAFTFDDGPDPETTPLILDALEAFGVPATFFVVGRRFANQNAESQSGSELLAEIASRGFTVGNHTSRHSRLDERNYKAGTESIERNAQDIAAILGYRPRLFRPPFGVITGKFRRLLRQRGDTLVMWSIDPRDFQRTANETLRKRVVSQILNNDGGVVLLHDTKKWTAHALPGILQDLENANCARLERGERPILPVSLHYFMRDADGSPRSIPLETVNSTQAALTELSKRCQNSD